MDLLKYFRRRSAPDSGHVASKTDWCDAHGHAFEVINGQVRCQMCGLTRNMDPEEYAAIMRMSDRLMSRRTHGL
jgi:hypothetical protein